MSPAGHEQRSARRLDDGASSVSDASERAVPAASGGTTVGRRAFVDEIDLWWRAANYLSVGQIYLRDNPLLRRRLALDDIKPRLLGHWGTCPGINLLWAHLNRIVVERDVSTMFVCGPGHGGPAVVANAWLDGTYSELYPDVGSDAAGLRRLFRQFSFPGGVPSHAAPTTPSSMHEGGELGYSLAHAYGAAFDRPDEVVVCMVGDGEAETGPLWASWQSHWLVDPKSDGAVLPVLHLNGYKIANPTVLARLPESTLRSLFHGLGYEPIIVSGDDPDDVHTQMIAALERAFDRIMDGRTPQSPPMLVLRTPKGWTGPDEIDGEPVEGHFRSHQVPIDHDLGPERLVAELERWLLSYGPDELFDDRGAPVERLGTLRPGGERRMSANRFANAVEPPEELMLPALSEVMIEHANTPADGDSDDDGDDEAKSQVASAMQAAGAYLRRVVADNDRTFRIMGPDEVASNRLGKVFEVTDRVWTLARTDTDVHLGASGRVMEVLSEHLCQGWLEGYVLSGRHGIFTSYEAFIHIVDSMFNQHAKWLETADEVSWRSPRPSFNYLLSSHVWRQDHNGFSHQDPGFLDVVVNKHSDVVRVYLPPDANTLIATLDRCLRSRDRVNVVVAGKQPEPQYLSGNEATEHLAAGIGIWPWAGNDSTVSDGSAPPDVVLGCAGDVPTMETIAAAELLMKKTDLVVRVVNVIDLTRLEPPSRNERGLDDRDYDRVFPPGTPTVFAFHGYPSLIHKLTYRRHHHRDLHVHGFIERGSTTTPFDMAVRNRIDRFHLAIAAVEHQTESRGRSLEPTVNSWRRQLAEHDRHVRDTGVDMEAITSWTFQRTS